MYDHVLGTDMSKKCASPYACLTIGFKEKETLSNSKLPKYFTLEDSQPLSCLLRNIWKLFQIKSEKHQTNVTIWSF